MVQALRVISVQRGVDPREYVLVSFGGAGGQHVCALAEALGMQRALVPVHAGVLSALGMLVAPRARQLSRTHAGLLADTAESPLREELQALAERAGGSWSRKASRKRSSSATSASISVTRGSPIRLTLPWTGSGTDGTGLSRGA